MMILKASGISKSFQKAKEKIEILKKLEFEMTEGEMVAITGASGAGKSTLLHILGTLEKPDSGEIFFGPTQQNILHFSEKGLSDFRNTVLGFVFQFHYLLPEFTALENVMMPSLISGKEPLEAIRQHAVELLEFVGLKHRLSHRPQELSGGEQQRVAIARSVIQRPKILMADELTGNLDTANTGLIMDLLVHLNRSTGISILLVTHDPQIAGKMHRIVKMKDGSFI
jgi:lipoprotein-releasing system ATP-binding protein